MMLHFLVAALFAFSVNPVSAATVSGGGEEGCALTLVGPVEEGDLERVKAEAGKAGLVRSGVGIDAENSMKALCLDSPGGLSAEGRAIMRFVHQNGIATRVTAGSECYSVCALIFMAGRIYFHEGDGPQRIMHVSGALGFHAPFIIADPNRTYTSDDLLRLSIDSAGSIADLLEFGSYQSEFNARPTIAMSLVKNLLRKGPTEVQRIETVEDAARWGIELDGIPETKVLSRGEMVQACVNFQRWSLDLPSRTGDLEWMPTTTFVAPHFGAVANYLRVDTGAMVERYCNIVVEEGPVAGLSLCSVDQFSGADFGDCGSGASYWVPWYYGLHPHTRLSDLAE